MVALFAYMPMKTEKYDISTEYRELAEEVIKEQDSLGWLNTVRIEYLECHEPKTFHDKAVMGKCVKIDEMYQVHLPFDFFIIIYLPNVVAFNLSREQKKILLHHELLHIGFDMTKDGMKYKIVPHDIEDFREILEKYGLDWSR